MAQTLAVFPLVLVRAALEFRAPVEYSAGRLDNVHCGELPLIAWVGISKQTWVGRVCRWCYINTAGEHVFAG